MHSVDARAAAASSFGPIPPTKRKLMSQGKLYSSIPASAGKKVFHCSDTSRQRRILTGVVVGVLMCVVAIQVVCGVVIAGYGRLIWNAQFSIGRP
jgi:hypothetical protein